MARIKKSRKKKVSFKQRTPSLQENHVEAKARKVTRKPSRVRVQYRQVVYVGTADKSTVKGSVTGKKYEFFKNECGMPKAIKVDEKDYPGIVVLKGKGCARRDPNALFMSKQDWDLELEEARVGNR